MIITEILVFLVCLAAIVLLVVTRYNIKLKKTGVDSVEKSADSAPHAPTATAAHATTHHHASGGGSHGHHDDHPKKSWQANLIMTCVALTVAIALGVGVWWLLVGMGFGQKPGLSHVERFNRYAEQTAARATPAAAVCTPVPVEWRDVTAPPNTAAKSAMIPIPDCHYLRFCDKKQDPECTAATFEGARFNVWCTTRTRDTELPLETSGDQAVNACRPQSKGSEPIPLEYAFIFSPPV